MTKQIVALSLAAWNCDASALAGDFGVASHDRAGTLTFTNAFTNGV